MTWERIKITLSCGCNPDALGGGFKWDAFFPSEEWSCKKHGKQTIKRMSRVTQK